MAYDLKSAEEVKEYLENLYTEYKFGCWKEKKAEVCHLLGDYEEAVNADFKKSAEIYKKTCDEYSYGRSCAKYGGYVAIGKGCTKNLDDAYKYLKKGCENNDGKGCAHYGMLCTQSDYEGPDKLERIRDGVKALSRSCYEMDQEKGCYQLASLMISGMPNAIERNFVEAYKASLKSCEYGNPWSCQNLSVMHTRGEGAAKNPALAKVFKERALELKKAIQYAQESVNFQQGT